MAWAVAQAEQLPVELSQAPRVGGVQHRLPDERERLLIVHAATVASGAAAHPADQLVARDTVLVAERQELFR